MRVLLQFNGKKKRFIYRNPKLSVPQLQWNGPGDVIECDSKDAELLTVGSDFQIVGSPAEPIPPEPINTVFIPVPSAVEEKKEVDDSIKRKPGRPKVINDIKE